MVFGTAPIQLGVMFWLIQTSLRSKKHLIYYGGTMFLLRSSTLVLASMAAHFNWPTQGARSRVAILKLGRPPDPVQRTLVRFRIKKSQRSSTRRSSSLYTTRKVPSSMSCGIRTNGSLTTMKKLSSKRSILRINWAWVVYLSGR